MADRKPFAVYQVEKDGQGEITWWGCCFSRHTTRQLAERAAKQHAKRLQGYQFQVVCVDEITS